MKADVKTKVCARLRSGVDKQGHAALRDADGCFCVMGIVADVVDPSGWVKGTRFIVRHRGHCSSLGMDTLIKAGMTDGEQDRLICANDDKEMTFPQLADMIEREM